ncbi:HepT-like ribonuclease domain-containing protein [Elusimicrobiota bacterium]
MKKDVLVHKYQGLDLSELYANLKEALPPLNEFLSIAKKKVRK